MNEAEFEETKDPNSILMPVLAKPEQKLKRDSDLWETDSGLDDMYKRQKQIEEIKRK